MEAQRHISLSPLMAQCDQFTSFVHGLAMHDASANAMRLRFHRGFWYSQWRSAAWKSYRHEVLRKPQVPGTEILIKLLRSCGWFGVDSDIVAISDRPQSIQRDSDGLLHSDVGPAVRYADGWSIYAIHGVRVPNWLVENPAQLSCAHIDKETNAEVRRIMIDRFGSERYLHESGADIVHTCRADHPLVGLRSARLLRKELARDEPIIMLDMLNSTPEPDGSVKRYLIRIDPHAYDGMAATDCHAALTSTYRMPDGSLLFADYRDYTPAVET
jgi:hypothetical protein